MNEEGPRVGIAAWRVAAIWAFLSAVAVLFAMPFLLRLIRDLPADDRLPMPVLVVGLVLQTGLISFVLAWLGTSAGRMLRVGSPLIEAFLAKNRVPLRKTLVDAVLWGALGGLLVIGLEAAFAGYMPTPLRMVPQPTPWEGLLASPYGGITEEVSLRLGALTLFAWVLGRLVGIEKHRSLVLSCGVVFAAMMFGLAHLPITSTIWPLNDVVVARLLMRYAIVGSLAGIVYVRHGLEHAVVLHFASDLVLYVLRPLWQA